MHHSAGMRQGKARALRRHDDRAARARRRAGRCADGPGPRVPSMAAPSATWSTAGPSKPSARRRLRMTPAVPGGR